MDELRGKTPQMVRKEIYAHLMAYNLLRTLMWEAGITQGVSPLRLSLQATRQHLRNFMPELIPAVSKQRQRLYRTLLYLIAQQPLLERPGRSEPRVRKRRQSGFSFDEAATFGSQAPASRIIFTVKSVPFLYRSFGERDGARGFWRLFQQ